MHKNLPGYWVPETRSELSGSTRSEKDTSPPKINK